MTAKELIAALQRCPPDLPVVLAYDSMVCQYYIDWPQMFIVDAENDECEKGIYLCAMHDDAVRYHFDEIGPFARWVNPEAA